MAALLAAMIEGGWAEPVLVLSNRPGAGGLDRARACGVPTEVIDHEAFATRAEFEAAIDACLKAHGVEIVCLAGFMRVLGAQFVSEWSGRMLNIHPSLLPRYKGLHTHARALAAGDAEHGCSVHVVTAELDGGPILGQARLRVWPGEVEEDLARRVLRLEHRLYPEVLKRFVTGDERPLELKEAEDGD